MVTGGSPCCSSPFLCVVAAHGTRGLLERELGNTVRVTEEGFEGTTPRLDEEDRSRTRLVLAPGGRPRIVLIKGRSARAAAAARAATPVLGQPAARLRSAARARVCTSWCTHIDCAVGPACVRVKGTSGQSRIIG